MNRPGSIPQEVLGEIIRYARSDLGTLCTLCLVSTSFLAEARRALYRDIAISYEPDDSSNGWFIHPEKAPLLFVTLTEHNTALSELVWRLYHNSGQSVHNAGSHYWTLVKRSLQMMVNLKKLTLRGIELARDLFEGCRFQLTSVGFGSYQKSRLHYEHSYDTIIQFLATQPHLESLHTWHFVCDQKGFPKTCCPRLDALMGNGQTIKNILPGRQVTRLTWIPESTENAYKIPPTITSEVSHIRVLALGWYDGPGCHLFLPYLPSLEVLCLFGAPLWAGFYIEYTHVFDLPRLRVLTWTDSISPSSSIPDHCELRKEDQRSLVSEWFGRSKTLEVAYVHSSDPDLPYHREYYCWKRGREEPIQVDFEEAVTSHGIISWA